MVTNNRTAYVVDNNTIFFYAGLMSEDLSEMNGNFIKYITLQ